MNSTMRLSASAWSMAWPISTSVTICCWDMSLLRFSLALGGGGAQTERVHRVIAELVAERGGDELVRFDELQAVERPRDDGGVEVIECPRRVDDRDLGAGQVLLDLRLDPDGRRHALGTLPEGFARLRP